MALTLLAEILWTVAFRGLIARLSISFGVLVLVAVERARG